MAVIPDGAQIAVSTWDAGRRTVGTKGVQLFEPVGDAIARLSTGVSGNILTENFVVLGLPLRGVSCTKLL